MNKFLIFRVDNNIFSSVNNLLIDLPCPINISFFWNFGSLLGITFIFQLITGIFLSMHFISDVNLAFASVDLITREISNGWILRFLHISGASMFFIFMYFHIGRNIYFFSFTLWKTWSTGVVIYFLSMAIAFLGYVLPWGQMSYWGATVITNFLSAVPYLGNDLVVWIWGGFAVDYPTLTRFFSFHFIFPFILLVFMILHLIFLHEKGSNNPLGLNSNNDKVLFFPLFALKDIFGFFLLFILFFFFFFSPNSFLEYQNFLEANALVTPLHIQPEWYFLPPYAVLRCIPNKLGGVLGLFSFIFILFLLPILNNTNINNNTFLRNSSYNFIFQSLFWIWIINFFLLMWLGASPVEFPYLQISRVCSLIYFFFFFCFAFF
uniref:Cytochrome b n=1 Tax=Bothromesostoma personatum TaxID=27905 RepID=A0A343VVI8_9PLAT